MKYGDNTVLDKLNLRVSTGQLLAVLGDFGSGKTTFLRAIIGLQAAESGRVILNGQDTTH